MKNTTLSRIACAFLFISVLLSFEVQAQNSSVSGNLQVLTGLSWDNARITIFNADTTFFLETRTNGVGDYQFPNIPNGVYTVGASKTDFEYQDTMVVVNNQNVIVNFLLDTETHPGMWNVIMQAPEELGGTDAGILMSDGRIFYCHDTQDPFLFDPQTNQANTGPQSPGIQGCFAARLLQDGSIIFLSGANTQVYGPGTRIVKTMNPFTNLWQVRPDLLDFRWYPSMVQLADGKLLVAGGGGLNNPVRTNTCEVYDPTNFTTQWVDTIAIGNEVSPIVMLHNGQVLMTHRPPQLYNPTTQQWELAANFQQGNHNPDGSHSDHEMVVMDDGKAVVMGFSTNWITGDIGELVEIYNPTTDSWSYGANQSPTRSQAKMVVLPGKKIMLAAGFKETTSDPTHTNPWGFMSRVDLYDYPNNSWRRLADMNYAREYHAICILVPDGRVIVVAGEGQPGIEPPASFIEEYFPPYLYRGVRPEILNLNQTVVAQGAVLTFDIAKTNAPTSVILMGTAAPTHFMNSGHSRYIELNYTQSGSQITAQIPADINLAPIGHYILFAMVDDIPSIGQIIRITNQPVSCSAVPNLWTSNVTPTSARLNWNQVAQTDHYQIRGRVVGGINWVTINIPNGAPSYKNVYGLANGQSYEWQIKTFCNPAGTVSSIWSTMIQFTTGCMEPASISTTNIQPNAALLNWTQVSGVAGYEIRGGVTGGGLITLLVGGSATTSKAVYGLQPLTQYRWQVRAWCTQNGSIKSDYTNFIQFTTAHPFNRLANEKDEFSIFPNPVSDQLVVNLQSKPLSGTTISVIDMNGRIMMKLPVHKARFNIDLNAISAGLYHVILNSSESFIIKKVIVVE